MYTFSELIRKIREEAGLTQAEFARVLGVSTVLIAMVETGQKEVSKSLLIKLAEKMGVHPASITPFLFASSGPKDVKVSEVERMLIHWGEEMQRYLIEKRAKTLSKYVKQ